MTLLYRGAPSLRSRLPRLYTHGAFLFLVLLKSLNAAHTLGIGDVDVNFEVWFRNSLVLIYAKMCVVGLSVLLVL